MKDMSLQFATKDDIATWDDLIAKNPDGGSVFQSYELAKHKKWNGWTARFIKGNDIAITVLEKYVFPLGNVWYLPKGPGVTTTSELEALLGDLKDLAKSCHVFVIKIEPEIIKTDETMSRLLGDGFIPRLPIQPNSSTILIDLSPDIDTVMANLNQKGRHAIRRAERDGVIVKAVEATDENCRLFYDLWIDTAEGKFRVRPFDYMKAFWQSFAHTNHGQLFFAYVDDQIVAGVYAQILGTRSIYKDGASVRERPVYGASHLLQWRVIEWAKEHGATQHDLCGTPPAAYMRDEKHPFYGLGRFKSSFNKTVTDYVGVLDMPIRPLAYRLWARVGERIAQRLSFQFSKQNWY